MTFLSLQSNVVVEWDEHKDSSNQRKHGVAFEDAAEVFRDPLRVSVQDRVVNYEERWQTIGTVDGILLVTVAHTTIDDAGIEVVRIISARRPTRQERRDYEEQNG